MVDLQVLERLKMVTIHIELNDTQALPVAIKAIERAIRSERGKQANREGKERAELAAVTFYTGNNPRNLNLEYFKKRAEKAASEAAQHAVNVEYLKRFCEELKKEEKRVNNEKAN